jgi:hypothetical protein
VTGGEGGGGVGVAAVDDGVDGALELADEVSGELGVGGARAAGETSACMLDRAGEENTGMVCMCARSKRKSRESVSWADEV